MKEERISRQVRIVVIDDYGERTVVNQRYAPGTVINFGTERVSRVFGKTRVLVYEDGEKLPEILYR